MELVLESLFDPKVLVVIKFFIKNESQEFYLREVSKLTKVPVASTFRILNRLVSLDILRLKVMKTAKLYSLAGNKTTDFLKSILEVDIVKLFVEKVSIMHGIEEILQLGNPDKSKANLLVLGAGFDNLELKRLCGELKEKFSYTINHMSLTREQYEQMVAMGLYPGSKKVLFKKT